MRRLLLIIASFILTACGLFQAVEPTPAVMPSPALTLATATAQTIAVQTAIPTATPVALPPTSRPTESPVATATVLAASPGPISISGRHLPPLGTFFFYWYNCPQNECDVRLLQAVPPGWLTPLPADADPRDGVSYSSYNYDWYEQELRTMAATGFDMIFPVSWGDHPYPWFRQDRLDLLVQANGVLEKPLLIGMFLDTTAQQGMYQEFLGKGYRIGSDVPRLPLSDPRSGYFFYNLHIRDFFNRVPPEMWATIDGRPVIITYTALCCDNLELSGELWRAVKLAFQADFGVEPWLILEETWLNPQALNPPAGMPSVIDVADGVYRWGTALLGPHTAELRGFRVSSVGPGFDNSRIPGVTEPRRQPRDEPPGGGPIVPGAFLRASLAAIPSDTDLVLIETWNEWPENTAVAPAAYTDRDGRPLPPDFYLQIIREWRASFTYAP
ncbi:MAG: DUF5010 domain-containing protein [Chloroflexus sp.]